METYGANVSKFTIRRLSFCVIKVHRKLQFEHLLLSDGPGVVPMLKAFCCADFSSVVRGHISELKPFSSKISFRKGESIYRLDEPATAIFWIEQGRAKTVILSPEGQEKIIGLYGPGDLFGELCLCEVARRQEQAIALEPVELLSIQTSGVTKLFAHAPEVSQAFLKVVCQRLMDYQKQVAMLSFDSVSRRLAKELMRLGQPDAESGAEAGARAVNGWTHEDLANLVGTTREVVTLMMNQFREKGMLDYGRRNIMIFSERMKDYLENSADCHLPARQA